MEMGATSDRAQIEWDSVPRPARRRRAGRLRSRSPYAGPSTATSSSTHPRRAWRAWTTPIHQRHRSVIGPGTGGTRRLDGPARNFLRGPLRRLRYSPATARTRRPRRRAAYNRACTGTASPNWVKAPQLVLLPGEKTSTRTNPPSPSAKMIDPIEMDGPTPRSTGFAWPTSRAGGRGRRHGRRRGLVSRTGRGRASLRDVHA